MLSWLLKTKSGYGKTEHLHVKEGNSTLTLHCTQNQLKTDKSLNKRHKVLKLFRRNRRGKAAWYWTGQWFNEYDPRSIGNKSR